MKLQFHYMHVYFMKCLEGALFEKSAVIKVRVTFNFAFISFIPNCVKCGTKNVRVRKVISQQTSVSHFKITFKHCLAHVCALFGANL